MFLGAVPPVDDSDYRERSAMKKNSAALPPDCEWPE
jgi:hypothetical protein